MSKLLTLASIVVAIAGLYLGRTVLIPFTLAIVFAFLLAPVVSLLEKFRLGRAPSALSVIILCLGFLSSLGWVVAGQLSQVLEQLPDYKANIHAKIESVRTSQSSHLGKAAASVNELSKELSITSEGAAKKKTESKTVEPIPVQNIPPPKSLADYARSGAGPLTGILETALITIVFTLFILLKREDLRNRLIRLTGVGQLNIVTQAFDEGTQRLGRYLLLQFVANAGYGLLFGVGLHVIGLPHALLWGILAWLLRFVPYLGTSVAAVFPLAMSLALFPGWKEVALVFCLFLVLELILANVIEPWLYGAHTGLSPVAILMAAIFWSLLWGPVGLILSTPLTVCLIMIGRYVPQLKFLEVLLGDEPALSSQARFYQRLLALDQDEANEIAEDQLKEGSLENLYDSILMPALSWAQQDRHKGALDQEQTEFVQQSVRKLIEDLDVKSVEKSEARDADLTADGLTVPLHPGVRIMCVPVRDEADEIVGIMAAQVFRRAGYEASLLSSGKISTILDRIGSEPKTLVCLSALPPLATVQTKLLCRQIKERCPNVPIILGLWNFQGSLAKAQGRLVFKGANAIATSLREAASLIEVVQLRSETLMDRTNAFADRAPSMASPANGVLESEKLPCGPQAAPLVTNDIGKSLPGG